MPVDMQKRQQGFIPMLICLLLAVAAAVILTYIYVSRAQQ